MAFLIVFFIVALSLCVIGLVVISLWWSSLFVAAIFGSVRGDWKSNRLHASSRASERSALDILEAPTLIRKSPHIIYCVPAA
jgi:hypothetical protein